MGNKGGLLSLGLLAVVGFLLGRGAKPSTGRFGVLSLSLIGPDGVVLDSPAGVRPGISYTARFMVTNQSVQSGEPVEAVLQLKSSGTLVDIILQVRTEASRLFLRNETYTYTRGFTVPSSVPVGSTGRIDGWVLDPEAGGAVLANATLWLTVESPALIKAASLNISI